MDWRYSKLRVNPQKVSTYHDDIYLFANRALSESTGTTLCD